MPDAAPPVPVAERTSVPASAIFSESELAPLEAPVVSARENDLQLTEPKPTAPVKPAEPAAPAVAPAAGEPKPGETPAPKPGEAPAAPAKPAEGAVPAAAPAAKPKVKIGNKEYTEEELEAALAAKNAPAAPAAAPTTPAAPAAPAPKPPTPEEIAAAESSWQEKFIKDEKLSVPITEKEMESILSGDKDGAALLSTKLGGIVAKAVLLARKSVYAELNPVIAQLQSNLQPLQQNQAQVEAAAAEHQFFTAYPDFKNHSDTVRRVGEALLTRFPKECAAMTREQLLAEVAAQSDRIIQAECERFAPGKKWRELQPAAAAAAPAAPAAPAPAAVAAPAASAAAPAAPTAPAVKPPAGNSPAATGSGGAAADWHKNTAASLKG